MSLTDLAKRGWIKPHRSSPSQIQERLEISKRDIATAKKLIGSDSDWAFSIAYNAVLQASRALMFSQGYRPSAQEGQHIASVRFAEVVLGKELGDDIAIFDKMRAKRHRVIYDVSGSISIEEAKSAFEFAVQFVEIVEGYLKKSGKKKESILDRK